MISRKFTLLVLLMINSAYSCPDINGAYTCPASSMNPNPTVFEISVDNSLTPSMISIKQDQSLVNTYSVGISTTFPEMHMTDLVNCSLEAVILNKTIEGAYGTSLSVSTFTKNVGGIHMTWSWNGMNLYDADCLSK